MTISIAALEAMAAAGISAEQIVAVIKADHAASAGKRTRDAARKRASRASAGRDGTSADIQDEAQAVGGAEPADTSGRGSSAGVGAVKNLTAHFRGKKDSIEGKKEQEVREERKKESLSNTRAREIVELFDAQFWPAYPKRGDAANPKKPARDKFVRLVIAGRDPRTIIAAALRYGAIERTAGRAGTDKVAQALTWLNQERFNDYPATAPPTDEPVWKQPPPEFLKAQQEKANAAAVGTEVRSDTRLGQNGADRSPELRLSG